MWTFFISIKPTETNIIIKGIVINWNLIEVTYALYEITIKNINKNNNKNAESFNLCLIVYKIPLIAKKERIYLCNCMNWFGLPPR